MKAKIKCAKWCGFGCTQKAFDQATREAKALAKSLGPGWKPDVWENWGWNYTVSNGSITVGQDRTGDHVKGGWKLKPRFTARIPGRNGTWFDHKAALPALQRLHRHLESELRDLKKDVGHVRYTLTKVPAR